MKQLLGATLVATCRAGGEAARAAARARAFARATAVVWLLVQGVHRDPCCASATLRGHLQGRRLGCVRQFLGATPRGRQQGRRRGRTRCCSSKNFSKGRCCSVAASARSLHKFALQKCYTPRPPAGQEVRLRGRVVGRDTRGHLQGRRRGRTRFCSCRPSARAAAFARLLVQGVHTGPCCTGATLRGRLQGGMLGCVRQFLGATLRGRQQGRR